MWKKLKYALVALLAAATIANAQTLSDQVLLLLSRTNTWTATQTFGDLTVTGTCTGCTGVGAGTVTSVAQSLDAALGNVLGISGTPITGTGTLALTLDTQTDNLVFAGPNGGGPTAPTFRALVDADIPDTITATTIAWTDLSFTSSTLADILTVSAADVTSGKLALAQVTTGTAGLPLVAGATDPIYAALDINTAANISGELAAANFPTLTGDITTAGGALATTLAASGVSANTYGSSSVVGTFTVDAKGRITAASDVAIATANMLSTTYCADCTASGATRGDLMYVPVGGSWDDLAIGSAGDALFSDGTDLAWGVDGTGLNIDVDNATAGDLALNRGGTAASLTAVNGGVVYSTASAMAITAAGTASQCLTSNGAAAPTWGACATLAGHALLSATHTDTVASGVTRGSIVLGNATPKYAELVIGAADSFLRSDGTDASWSTDGSGLTLLNASNLASGTVPSARLGIIAVTAGGTGLASYVIGDIIYASASTTLARIADPAVGSVLISGGVGVAPAWSTSPTITDLTMSGILYEGSTSNITASAVQAQGEQVLTTTLNVINTVGTTNDVVTMPAAAIGARITIVNEAATNTLQIYPSSGDDLGDGVDISVFLAANEALTFLAYDATSWTSEGGTGLAHAEMHDTDNTDAFVINAQDEEHSYHSNLVVTGDVEEWTFDIGGGGTSFAIASIADAGGGDITVTTTGSHLLAIGDIISQTNLSDAAYVGVFQVLTVPGATTYTVTAVYTATGTGTMDQASTLTVTALGAGQYHMDYGASATGAASNQTFDFSVFVDATEQVTGKARSKFGTSGDFRTVSGTGIVVLGVGDKISFAVENIGATGNITVRNLTLTMTRL